MTKINHNKKKFLQFIVQNLKEKRYLIILFFLFSLLLGIIESSVVGSLKPITDILQNPGEIYSYNIYFNSYFKSNIELETFRKIFFIFFIILFLFSGFLSLTCIFLSNKVREDFHYSWKMQLCKNYFQKDLFFFNKYQSGDLIQKMLVHTREGASFFYELSIILRESFVALTIYVLLLFVSFKYTIYITILAIVIFSSTWMLGKLTIVKQTIKRNESQKKIFSITEIIFRGIKTIKSFNKEDFFEKMFLNESLIYKNKEILTSSLVPLPAIFLRNLVFIIIVVGVFLITSSPTDTYNTKNISLIALFIGGFYKINNSFGAINNAILTSSKLYPSLQIISQEISDKIFDDNNKYENINFFDLKNFQNTLEYKNIDYKYPGNNFLSLKNINLKFKKSSSNLIIGPSGSGKSTLIDIIAGFKNSEGTINIDDFKDVRIKDIRFKNFSYLGQNSLLFPGTIQENIVFFEKNLDKNYYDKIIKVCQITDILKNFTLNINFEDNEVSKLSEGQKQRICLARTLYSNKPIIILDEALSNIEKSLEKQIINDVLELIRRENKTLIVVSHSLKNYEGIDQIIVISDGKVVQIGSHSELKKIEGFYKKNF